MGKLNQGLLGSFTGKTGPVTGYIRNGQPMVRISRNSVTAKKTPARMAQQEKIRICNGFTRTFSGSDFFKKCFPAYGHTGHGYNRATSAIMNLAISGEYPNLQISYPLVLISKGPLPMAENAFTQSDVEGNIEFSWTDNSGNGTAKSSDKVILVAFFPEINEAVFSIGDGERAHGRAILDTRNFKGLLAETWIGFLSNDEKDAGDSVYAGRVDIPL